VFLLVFSPRSGGLVDYDDDEDDEDYKPPPRKQPEASEEDEEALELLGTKRKLPLKDKVTDVVHKQKMSKSSKSKDTVFSALCSTLSQAVLPGKKTAINDHSGDQTIDGRMSSTEDNQEKDIKVSRSCSENSNTTAEENHVEKETDTPRNFSDGSNGTTDNGQLGGEEHSLVSPKSSPEMAVKGS
jgi:protein phosphatase 4 regulatory subunit 3